MAQVHDNPLESIDDEVREFWRKAGDFLLEVKRAEDYLAELNENPKSSRTGFYRLLYAIGLYDPCREASKIVKKILKKRAYLDEVIEAQKGLLQEIEKRLATSQKCSNTYEQHHNNYKAILDEKSKKYGAICAILAKPELSMPENMDWAEFLSLEKVKLEHEIELVNDMLARVDEIASKTCMKISNYEILVRVIKYDIEYSLKVISKFDEVQKDFKIECYEHTKPVQPKSCTEA